MAGVKTSGTYQGAVINRDSACEELTRLPAHSQEQGGRSRPRRAQGSSQFPSTAQHTPQPTAGAAQALLASAQLPAGAKASVAEEVHTGVGRRWHLPRPSPASEQG